MLLRQCHNGGIVGALHGVHGLEIRQVAQLVDVILRKTLQGDDGLFCGEGLTPHLHGILHGNLREAPVQRQQFLIILAVVCVDGLQLREVGDQLHILAAQTAYCQLPGIAGDIAALEGDAPDDPAVRKLFGKAVKFLWGDGPVLQVQHLLISGIELPIQHHEIFLSKIGGNQCDSQGDDQYRRHHRRDQTFSLHGLRFPFIKSIKSIMHIFTENVKSGSGVLIRYPGSCCSFFRASG